MIDYQALLLDPIYSTLGVPAAITLADSDETVFSDLTVIDKTSGVELGDQNAQVNTLTPACCIRHKELTDKGIDPAELDDAQIEFNGSRWKIKGRPKRPVPSGARQGEILFILANEIEVESSS